MCVNDTVLFLTVVIGRIISMVSPDDSWVAKWQRVSKSTLVQVILRFCGIDCRLFKIRILWYESRCKRERRPVPQESVGG